jgi:hypothetical protein
MGAHGWAVIATVCRTGRGPLVNFAHFQNLTGTSQVPLSLIARADEVID